MQKIFFFLIATLLVSCNSHEDKGTANLLIAKDYFKSAYKKDSLGDFKGAVSDYNKYIELNPLDYAGYLARGLAKVEIKDFKGAMSDYNKVIMIDFENKDAYYARGILKGEKLKDLQGAILDFSKVITLAPNSPDGYYSRGIVEMQLNKKDSGCLDFKKAEELGYSGSSKLIKKYCNP